MGTHCIIERPRERYCAGGGGGIAKVAKKKNRKVLRETEMQKCAEKCIHRHHHS